MGFLLRLGDLVPSDLGHMLALLCAGGLITLGVRSIYLWYRLRHIPGPRYAGWSVWWQLSAVLSERMHELFKEASDAYGPLMRVGPNELMSTDPEVLRYMSSARSTYTKGAFYESGRVVPGIDNIVSVRDVEQHKKIRAKMTPGFSGKVSEQGFSFEPGMNRQLQSFIRLLERKYISTERETRPVDLAEKTFFFAMDAIGDVSMGAPFGYVEKDKDLYDFNKINTATMPVMTLVSALPWLIDIAHKWPFRLVLPKETDHYGFGRLMDFARNYIDKRLEPGAEPLEDIMQSHINSGLTPEELIQQVFINIIAGSNSTAHATRMTILSLTATPSALARLLAEIRNAKDTAGSIISWAHTQQLPYLQAVVREGLRMWPPVGGLSYKLVPPGGDHLNGYFVPGGTNVGHNFYGVARSKSVWGEDADVFRPDRWLLPEGEELKKMMAAVDTHFGHGQFSCLGKPIALMEIHKTVFELLRRYEICVLDPEKPIKTQAAIFFMASDFWVRLTERVW